MRYGSIRQGIFLSRPNRFIAQVELDGETVAAHVKNTGRCKELLVPGAAVWLEESGNPNRKTRYDLIEVEKETAHGPLMVNMDSQAPNRMFREWAEAGHFRQGLTLLRPETTWGKSRFDFYWEAGEKKGFVEVKGVTLEAEGWARFPDAPTLRGVKHLEELMLARKAGYEAAVCFVIQMAGMRAFSPNDETHPEFGAALRRAGEAGVEILAYGCRVEPGFVEMAEPVAVLL